MSSKLKRLSAFIWCLLVLNEVADSFTVTTFNILAPVHRSMGGNSAHRESDKEQWWRPRAEAVAKYISDNLVSLVLAV